VLVSVALNGDVSCQVLSFLANNRSAVYKFECCNSIGRVKNVKVTPSSNDCIIEEGVSEPSSEAHLQGKPDEEAKDH